ncbi:hypothetical protein JFU47_32090 [Pseudomonas sp. TH39(2020)]|uniref:hypothetical protein n=1 Tax=Pseudomonas sp. TH39(2020) TaxID=2796349 RepID=UPI001914C47D|nr:hypothetical protein [Pseudomonas sp. TH39(2020)]MBK5401318.1 hypothetical protein [Pseudomonas sp. TH39(2020)]
MATVTLTSTTSHGEALALAGALLEWCATQDADGVSVKTYTERGPDGAVTISTTPALMRLVQ